MILLQLHPKSVLDKYFVDFQDYLIKTIQDSNVQVRKRARIIFLRFAKIWPNEAHTVMTAVEQSYQKAIIEEASQIDLDIESYIMMNKDIDMSIVTSRVSNLGDRTILEQSQLGNSLVLVSSNGNQIQGENNYSMSKFSRPPQLTSALNPSSPSIFNKMATRASPMN